MSKSHLIFIMICVVVSLRIIDAAILVRRASQSTVAAHPATSIVVVALRALVAQLQSSDLADGVRDEFPAVVISTIDGLIAEYARRVHLDE